MPLVREGTLIKLRCKGKQKNIVISVSFVCPCGKRNRQKVGAICGQNETKVQFFCNGCHAVVEFPKQPDRRTSSETN